MIFIVVMKIQINSFDELIQFIETNNLTPKQLTFLIESTLKVYVCAEDLNNITEKLKAYWIECENKPNIERPLFLWNPLNDKADNYNKMLQSESFKKKIDEFEAYY
jgi:hypothetical protein